MRIVKFAYILMGKNFSQAENSAHIFNAYNDATVIGVDNIKEACQAALQLKAKGYECIELCGAFGADGAKAILKATDNELAIGYSVHFSSQDKLFDQVFS
ncbi:MAG: DUF6506 family protein [Hespellia sp.]|nr:DUF6506 family protein [Hespellia sp.]